MGEYNPLETFLNQPNKFCVASFAQIIDANNLCYKQINDQAVGNMPNARMQPTFLNSLQEVMGEDWIGGLPIAVSVGDHETWQEGNIPFIGLSQHQALLIERIFPGARVSYPNGDNDPTYAQLCIVDGQERKYITAFIAQTAYWNFGTPGKIGISPGLEKLISENEAFITGIFMKPTGNSDKLIQKWGPLPQI
jgi:hypothetical protein